MVLNASERPSLIWRARLSIWRSTSGARAFHASAEGRSA